MKSVFFAIALFCSGTDGSCQLVETVASPHIDLRACEQDLVTEMKGVHASDLDKLLTNGGYFSAACLTFQEGYKISEHVEDVAKRLGRPEKYDRKQFPRVDG